MLDSAIVKHDACAAAMSCSGLAPGPSSKRDLKEYWPLIVSPAVNVPDPARRSPFHSAVPLAGMADSFVWRSLFGLFSCYPGNRTGRGDHTELTRNTHAGARSVADDNAYGATARGFERRLDG